MTNEKQILKVAQLMDCLGRVLRRLSVRRLTEFGGNSK